MKPSQIILLITGIAVSMFIGACASTPGPTVESGEGVQITLTQCDRLNSEYHCQLSMMTETQDASIEIKDTTKLQDDQGNVYPLTAGKLADMEIKNGLYAKAQKELKAGVPVQATFIFQNIANNAKAIELLTVGGRVKIRNQVLWHDFAIELEAPVLEEK